MAAGRSARASTSALAPLILALALLAPGTSSPTALADEEERWTKLDSASADPEATAAAIAGKTAAAVANEESTSSSREGSVVLQARSESGRDEEAGRWNESLEKANARLEAAGFTLSGDADTVLIHLRPASGPMYVATSADGSVIVIREPVSSEPPPTPALPKRADGPLLVRDLVAASDRALVLQRYLVARHAKAAGPGWTANALARRAVGRASLPEKTPPWLLEAIVAWVEEAAFPASKGAPLHLCGGAAGKAFAPATIFDPKTTPSAAQARVLGRVFGSLAGDRKDVADAVARVAGSADRGSASLSAAFGADAAATLAALLKSTPPDPHAACDSSATVPCPACRGAARLDVECLACLAMSNVACPACRGGSDCWSPHCVNGVQRFWQGEPKRCKLCRGEGWYLCDACKATGRTPCKACGGAGRATWPCLACGGKGRVPCPDAGAAAPPAGADGAGPPCPWCRGAPLLAPCPTCGGAGFAGCRTCNGSLKKMCPTCFGLGCTACGGRGFEYCSECDKGRLPCPCGGKGSVRLESARCPGCAGTGLALTAAQAARRIEWTVGGLSAEDLQKNGEMLARAKKFLLESATTSPARFAFRENRFERTSPTGKLLESNPFSNALVLWTLFAAGMTQKDEELHGPWSTLETDARSILEGSLRDPPTLQMVALVLRALVAGGSPPDGELVSGLVTRLAKAQRPSGFWAEDLVSKDPGDAFQALFALESLWLARRAGAKVPGEVWSRALDSSAKLSGAITKSKGKSGWLTATDVASSAALASIAKAGAAAGVPRLDDVRSVQSVQQGLAWLDRHFDLRRQPVVNGGALVTLETDAGFEAYLYSLQRLCQLLSIDTIGGERWHRAGTRKLLETQLPDGSFEELGIGRLNGPVRGTCAAVLFLVRATPPLTESKADSSDNR